MAAGMPGAGIGGLFYLVATVALPLRSVWRRLRGEPDTLTARQLAWHLGIAGGIIGGIWLAGWLLALVLPGGVLSNVARSGGALSAPPHLSVVRTAAVAAGLLTLGVVLGSVEIARLVLRARRRDVPSAAPRTSRDG